MATQKFAGSAVAPFSDEQPWPNGRPCEADPRQAKCAGGASVFTATRDYHAENPDLACPGPDPGVARVGLLDFQDALRAHPAWDLSMLLLMAAAAGCPPEREERRALPDPLSAACAAGSIAAGRPSYWPSYHGLGALNCDLAHPVHLRPRQVAGYDRVRNTAPSCRAC